MTLRELIREEGGLQLKIFSSVACDKRTQSLPLSIISRKFSPEIITLDPYKVVNFPKDGAPRIKGDKPRGLAFRSRCAICSPVGEVPCNPDKYCEKCFYSVTIFFLPDRWNFARSNQQILPFARREIRNVGWIVRLE